MSHKLAHLFDSKGCFVNIQNYQIPYSDLNLIRSALIDDINGFMINGLISLSSSINSLNKENYSWSFIQSYYSLFYFARAFNGINDYAIVYTNNKPYGIKIQPSAKFEKLSGNSHDVVLKQFKTHLRNDILLINTIENNSPVDWFNKSRNYINYALNPQTDPIPPINLFRMHKNKTALRKWIQTYIDDVNHIYTFDSTHCYLAYPLQLFLRINKYYIDNERKNNYIDDERIEYFKKNICDEKGPITPFIFKIKELSI